jgi:hypothetical protein
MIQKLKAKKVDREMVFKNSISLKMKIGPRAFENYDFYPLVSVKKGKFLHISPQNTSQNMTFFR